MNNLNRLKDIYPLESLSKPISANFTSTIILATIMIIITVVLVKLAIKKEKKIEEITLKDIDFSKDITKEKLYKFTKIAKKSVKTKKQKEQLEELLKSIEKFKYKKETPDIDKDTIENIKRYIKICS